MFIGIFKSAHPQNLLILLLVFLGFLVTATFIISFKDFLLPLDIQLANYIGIYSLKALSVITLITSLVLFNLNLNREELLPGKGFLPLLFLSLATIAILPFALEPINCLLLLLVTLISGKVLKFGYNTSAIGNSFDIGFLFGLAALLKPEFVFFLLWVYHAHLVLRNFNWREWVLPLVGLLTPFVFHSAYSYLLNKPYSLLTYLPKKVPVETTTWLLSWPITLHLVVCSVILLVSIPSFLAIAQTNKVRVRKTLYLLFWFLVYGIIYSLLMQDVSGLLISFFLTFSLIVTFRYYKKTGLFFNNILFVILVISFLVSYFAQLN